MEHKITRYRTHYTIIDYDPGDFFELEKSFSTFENWTYKPIGWVYDEDRRELRLFGGANAYGIHVLTGEDVYQDYRLDDIAKISVRLRNTPKNLLQREIIQFLIGKENEDATQLVCNADTGEGKTFCAIAAITFMKSRTIIIVNRLNIRDSWITELASFTDLDELSICTLDRKHIEAFYKNPMKADRYKVFIAVHRTLGNVAKENGYEFIEEFFRKMKFGLKIYDEAHREFKNTTMIDCFSNVKKTLYLSATMKLSDFDKNEKFKRLFKDVKTFDQRARGYTDSKKHITMVALMYNSHPSIEDQSACKNIHGFQARTYAIYQLDIDKYFMVILSECIEKFAIKKNLRTIVMVGRIFECDELTQHFQELYPDVTIMAYHSKISLDDKTKCKEKAHIIFSTIESLGLGINFTNTRCIINCQPFSFDAIGDQTSGRLRKWKEGEKSIYIEVMDFGFRSIRQQWKYRERHYKEIFGSVIKLDESGGDLLL